MPQRPTNTYDGPIRSSNHSAWFFFLKAPGALGSHVRFLGVRIDRTQCRRGYPNSLGTRHTEALTPPHTLTPTTHARFSTWCDTRARPRRESNPGGQLHDGSAYHRATSAFAFSLVLLVPDLFATLLTCHDVPHALGSWARRSVITRASATEFAFP